MTLGRCVPDARTLLAPVGCFERRGARGTLLFFCDLPDADTPSLPGDADLIRCVQSAVMSMEARRPGQIFFLVRKRSRCPRAGLYLGEGQKPGVRAVISALITGGHLPPFEASSLPAGALSRADAVFFTRAGLSFLPDTPARMLSRLPDGEDALCGRIVYPLRENEPLLTRLLRKDFSLDSPIPHLHAGSSAPGAYLCRAAALPRVGRFLPAQDCPFFVTRPPDLSELFSRLIRDSHHAPAAQLLVPAGQVLLLFVCAFFGLSLPAALALLLPEAACLRHPSRLPGALVRLALLPRRALTAINALLRRALSGRSWSFSFATGSGAGPLFGAVLFILSLRGTHALAVLLPAALLFFCAPAIEQALSLPARERIPLTKGEQETLLTLAREAYAALAAPDASPALALCACAACMLGFLEPDEAARWVEGMLDRLSCRNAFDCACLWAAAQFLTGRMGDCDAALRSLPARVAALGVPPQEEDGLLASFLRATASGASASCALDAMRRAGRGGAMDALFLPRERMCAAHFLPLTHVHTFLLREENLPHDIKDPLPALGEADRFLILAGAALNAPFHALLLAGSAAAPYAPLFDLL